MPRSSITVRDAEEEQVRELYRLLQVGPPALVGADEERVELPASVYNLLKEAVQLMQAGHAVSLVSDKQQVSTQRAADILGVSRPYLIKLIECGELPCIMTGSHRRVYLTDVMAYATRRDARRHAALNELARRARDAGLYEKTRMPEGSDE
jgi:excisionase family DNA binding protein